MVETAGQSVQGVADMSLTGIIDARKFREMVLDQRDLITDKSNQPSSLSVPKDGDHELIPYLQKMQSTLESIEAKLGEKSEK